MLHGIVRPFGSGACLKCAVPSAVARAQQVESARSDQPDLRRFFADQSIFRSDRADPQAVGGQTRPRRDIASPTQNESNIGCKRIRLPVIGGAMCKHFSAKWIALLGALVLPMIAKAADFPSQLWGSPSW